MSSISLRIGKIRDIFLKWANREVVCHDRNFREEQVEQKTGIGNAQFAMDTNQSII